MKKIIRPVVLLCVMVIYACATGTVQDDSGKNGNKTVPEEKRIQLQDGGPYKGEWVTRDLTFLYEYQKDSGRVEMMGEVKFKRTKRLDTFSLEANLIDTEGQVLDQQRIASAGGRRMVEVVPVKAEIKAPDATWGVAFSYTGVTRGVGEGAGSPNQFWMTPW